MSFEFGSFPGSGLLGGASATGGSGFSDMRFGGMGTGRGGVPYPSPFFDNAQMYMPTTMKKLLRWCRFYFFTNPIVNAVCYKMASYPITELVFEGDKQVVEKYTRLKDDVLGYKRFLVEVGLDHRVYGNAFVSVWYPFIKHLKCKHCGFIGQARELRKQYRWRDFEFYLTCPTCQQRGAAIQEDVYIKSPDQIRLVRWDPEKIHIENIEESGQCRYYYSMSPLTRNQIMVGKDYVIETMPQVFIEASKKNMPLLFGDKQVYHMKRATLAGKDSGWGTPQVLPVLKDCFYLQILKKGQEAISREHINPLRILFPQPGSGSSDPYTSIDLSKWKMQVEHELERWRRDPNYIPIMGLPMGYQLVGGTGRAMMLHQELRVWAEQICAGLLCPNEFVFGGMSWSGTNVSMRQLENEFINYRTDINRLTAFVFDGIRKFLQWPELTWKFRRFKMADDLQKVMIYFQANQAGKISDHTLLRELEEDYDREQDLKAGETKVQAAIQRTQQLAGAAAQAEAQQVMARYQPAGPDPAQSGQPSVVDGPLGSTLYPENGQSPPTSGLPPGAQSSLNADSLPGMDIGYVAKRAAAALRAKLRTAPQEAYQELQAFQKTQPHLAALVLQILRADRSTRDTLDPMQLPLPQVKPPRRDISRAVV